jgi:hypothetical protein
LQVPFPVTPRSLPVPPVNVEVQASGSICSKEGAG